MPQLSKAELTVKTPEGLRREIAEINSTIQTMSAAQRRACSAVRAQGVEIWKTVMDSSGVSRRVRRINPAVKRLKECEAAIRSLGRSLARLTAEQTALEMAAQKSKDPLAFLDDEETAA
jgi:prefoldin subunit 5